MAYESLLTDRCDLYHLTKETVPGKYGTPAQEIEKYPVAPDATSVPCYVSSTQSGASVIQLEPHAVVRERFKVHFPVTAPVQHLDKMRWQGKDWKVIEPRPIRSHHIEATIERM